MIKTLIILGRDYLLERRLFKRYRFGYAQRRAAFYADSMVLTKTFNK